MGGGEEGHLTGRIFLIDFRERGGGEREKNVDLLFHFFIHSWVVSCICLD